MHVCMCISHLHLGGVTLLSSPPFLSLSGQAASAREAEHLRAMLAAAEVLSEAHSRLIFLRSMNAQLRLS